MLARAGSVEVRYAVETRGTLHSMDGEILDRATLETDFDTVAAALADLHHLEADVAMNLETAQLEFFMVVEAANARDAMAAADRLMDEVLAEVGALMQWDETSARQADLVPA